MMKIFYKPALALSLLLSNKLVTLGQSRLLRADDPITNKFSVVSQEKEESETEDRNLAIQSYTQLSYTEIEAQLQTLANNHPQFVTLYTSQDKYGLPLSCGNGEVIHAGCHNSFLIIEDPLRYSHSDAARAKTERPDVLISGALHGDERVGPVAALETAKLLALAASCQANIGNKTACDALITKHGAKTLKWLARLVSTRRIIIIPTTNAKGYYMNIREEKYVNNSGSANYIDPNRDFAFDQQASKCMTSITARTLNELFLDHLVQLSMTYHGGTEMITYEWGHISIPYNKMSPDDEAQDIFSRGLSRYAGRMHSSGGFYQYGQSNDILYGVNGGMEDWVYAASWKTDYVPQCNPSSYGGYPASKTIYDDSTLSTFNILIETSYSKNPSSSNLGSDKGLFQAPFDYDGYVHNGYVAKNIRTMLLAIDVVEPYVELFHFKSKILSPEVKPRRAISNRKCKIYRKKNSVKVNAQMKWKVGGSFTVDDTWLVYGKWSDFPSSFDCTNQLTQNEIASVINNSQGKFYVTTKQSGNTRWTDPNSGADPSFSDYVDLRKFNIGDQVAIFAIAKVDQNWKDQPDAFRIWPSSDTKPQSHMVNSRTDPNYVREKPGIDRKIQGRLHWISEPLTVKIIASK